MEKFFVNICLSDVMLINILCDGYGFPLFQVNWANHCDWIWFGEDEDGNRDNYVSTQAQKIHM